MKYDFFTQGYIVGLMLMTINACAAQDNAVTKARYDGTLGAQRIGMTLLVKNGQLLPDSHYFYFKHLTNIALTGSATKTLSLQEPGGGTFELQFTGKGSNGKQPLTFNNSVGLQGSWHAGNGNGKSYPVVLTGGGESNPSYQAGGRWYQTVTNKSDADYEAQAQGFYKAVLAADRAAAARYVSFPLRVNFSANKHQQIKTPAELSAQWTRIFNTAWLKQAANQAPHDMSILTGRATLGPGLVYFDEEGKADIINARVPVN